jgi:hypothetical protein
MRKELLWALVVHWSALVLLLLLLGEPHPGSRDPYPHE